MLINMTSSLMRARVCVSVRTQLKMTSIDIGVQRLKGGFLFLENERIAMKNLERNKTIFNEYYLLYTCLLHVQYIYSTTKSCFSKRQLSREICLLTP